MDREAFEHVIAAAASALGEDEFVVIGSQAILGSFPDAPEPLLRSMEVDMFPRADPSRAIEIDASLGDGSRFQQAFGYYAHGVGPETAKPPKGWESRLVRVEIPPRVGSEARPIARCLEPHDLVLAKCAAGRERDWQFAADAVAAGLVRIGLLVERARELPLGSAQRESIVTQLLAIGPRRDS